MKFLFFFVLIGLFVWIAVVPPDGMSKFPAVNVEFEYSRENGVAQIHVGTANSDDIVQEAGQE